MDRASWIERQCQHFTRPERLPVEVYGSAVRRMAELQKEKNIVAKETVNPFDRDV